MNSPADSLLHVLDDVVALSSAASSAEEFLPRVIQQLRESNQLMAWDIVPLSAFGGRLPESIRSCWIFAIRAGAQTTPERHPNSHQRSFSLTGSGTFDVHERGVWVPHRLVSTPGTDRERRWVSIPPSTWHRLIVGPEVWGMVSFHTVTPGELIEEKPVDPDHLDGETSRERYTDRG
jgi:hypothetical protein